MGFQKGKSCSHIFVIVVVSFVISQEKTFSYVCSVSKNTGFPFFLFSSLLFLQHFPREYNFKDLKINGKYFNLKKKLILIVSK